MHRHIKKEKNRGRVSWTHDFDVSFVISKLQFCLFFLMRIIFIYLFIFFLNIRTASWSRCHNVHHQHQLRLRSSNGNMKFSNSQTPNFISYAQNYISKIQYSIYIHNDVCFARVIQFPSPQKHAQSSTTNLFAHKHKINESPKHTHTHHNLAYYTYIRALTRLSALLFGGGGDEEVKSQEKPYWVHSILICFVPCIILMLRSAKKINLVDFICPPPPQKKQTSSASIYMPLFCVCIYNSPPFFCVCVKRREKKDWPDEFLAGLLYIYMWAI